MAYDPKKPISGTNIPSRATLMAQSPTFLDAMEGADTAFRNKYRGEAKDSGIGKLIQLQDAIVKGIGDTRGELISGAKNFGGYPAAGLMSLLTAPLQMTKVAHQYLMPADSPFTYTPLLGPAMGLAGRTAKNVKGAVNDLKIVGNAFKRDVLGMPVDMGPSTAGDMGAINKSFKEMYMGDGKKPKKTKKTPTNTDPRRAQSGSTNRYEQQADDDAYDDYAAYIAREKAAKEAQQGGGSMGIIHPDMAKMFYHGGSKEWAASPGSPLGKYNPERVGTGQGEAIAGAGLNATNSSGIAKNYAAIAATRNSTPNKFVYSFTPEQLVTNPANLAFEGDYIPSTALDALSMMEKQYSLPPGVMTNIAGIPQDLSTMRELERHFRNRGALPYGALDDAFKASGLEGLIYPEMRNGQTGVFYGNKMDIKPSGRADLNTGLIKGLMGEDY
jgi:hypothetical protein